MSEPPTAKWFTPLKSKPKPRKIATLDCEGNGAPGAFVCAAVVSDRGRFTFTKRQDAIDYIFSKELRDYWIFSHNLEYDLATLTSGDLRPYRVIFAGNRILWAELTDSHRHRWRLVDSANIFSSTSIKELGLMVGWAKIELHYLLDAHIKAGKPLSILPEFEQQQILSYCLRDADILYLAISGIQEELLKLGAELRPTIGGISMDLYRRGFMEKSWPVIDPAINRLARVGYFGARTEPFRLGRCHNVNGYDVSSLYPSVMREIDFPHPGYLILDNETPSEDKIWHYEGITQATVIVPDDDPPILPGRIHSHLFFPTGELTQAWPHSELRYALENGAKIQKIDWTLWARYSFSPFQKFIDTLYSKRILSASSSKIKEAFYKLLLNSSYGRFGLNPESGLSELIALSDNDQWQSVQGATLHFINNWPYAIRSFGEDSQPAYANSMIAAYVTAAGRIKMHKLIKQNLDNLIYTDTDSLWSSGEIETASGIGQLRQIEENRDFWVTAPKEYAVFSGEHLIDAKVKGIPEAHRLMFLRHGRAQFYAPVGLREGIQRGLTPATWIVRTREKRYALPKRPAVGVSEVDLESYPTRPWRWPELLQAFDLAEAHQPEWADDQFPKVSHLQARLDYDPD